MQPDLPEPVVPAISRWGIARRSSTLSAIRASGAKAGLAIKPKTPVDAILKALEIATREPERRARLWENASYFRSQLNGLGIDTGDSATYIMPLVVGDRDRMCRLGHELRRRGLWVAPVDYPAVPEDRICFRACVTADHTRADLDEALNIVSDTFMPAELQHAHSA